MCSKKRPELVWPPGSAALEIVVFSRKDLYLVAAVTTQAAGGCKSQAPK